MGFVDSELPVRAFRELNAQTVGNFRLEDMDGKGLDGVIVPLAGARELWLYR